MAGRLRQRNRRGWEWVDRISFLQGREIERANPRRELQHKLRGKESARYPKVLRTVHPQLPKQGRKLGRRAGSRRKETGEGKRKGKGRAGGGGGRGGGWKGEGVIYGPTFRRAAAPRRA